MNLGLTLLRSITSIAIVFFIAINAKQTLAASVYSLSCISPPLPTTPGSPNYTFNTRWMGATPWKGADSMTITVWRQPCKDDPTKSAVLLRVFPVNTPKLGSFDFCVIQGASACNAVVQLVTEPGGSGVSTDLTAPMTFLLDQWFAGPRFDEQSAFQLAHMRADNSKDFVSIPAYVVETPAPTPVQSATIALEEPGENFVYTGIGNLRGWAISSAGIESLELYIDDNYVALMPYGGSRADVGNAYPTIPDSANSGFSMAFAYGLLDPGQHRITVRANTFDGKFTEDSATFTVIKFHESFFSDPKSIDIGSSTLSKDGQNIRVNNLSVDGQLYNVGLRWNSATQGFEIIDIQQ